MREYPITTNFYTDSAITYSITDEEYAFDYDEVDDVMEELSLSVRQPPYVAEHNGRIIAKTLYGIVETMENLFDYVQDKYEKTRKVR